MFAIDLGNLPQWISAIAASILVIGAIVLLAHGRRTDIEVTAEARRLPAGDFLDVRVTMSPVGSLRNRPYKVVGCVWCNENRIVPDAHGQLSDDMWIALKPCPSRIANPHLRSD